MAAATPQTIDAVIELAQQLAADPPLQELRSDPAWHGRRDPDRTERAVLVAATAHNLDIDDVWDELAAHHSSWGAALAAVAGPTRHLGSLIATSCAEITEAAAQHPAATPAQLEELLHRSSGSLDARILTHLVRHHNAAGATIDVLARRAIDLVAAGPQLWVHERRHTRVRGTRAGHLSTALTTLLVHPDLSPELSDPVRRHLDRVQGHSTEPFAGAR